MGLRSAGESPTAAVLRSRLAPQRALLVLDNCEHLADAVAAFVDSLTTGAPRVSVLVTSQETLRAADEHVYRLGALALPAATDTETALQSGAVELFAARALAVDPHFTLSAANLPAVIEICRRLDGIPLAIELAAARLPLLGLDGLRSRLHERFSLLTGGARMVLRRHQTLRATLEWSHALLTPDEQIVFRRLGVFAGGFTLELAQDVASDERIDPWTTLDHLGALVDKSLVLAEGDAIPRYRMLETTRAYSLEQLAEANEMHATLRRHAHAMLALLEPFEQYDWRWRATGGVVDAAKVEIDNLRAALEWTDTVAGGRELAVALAGVSYSVWWSSFQLAEGLARCLHLRPHVDAGTSSTVAARFWLTLAKLGVYSIRRESYDAAVQAAALYRELHDDQRLFEALTFAAVQGTRFATVAEMEAEIDEAARLEQPEWPARQRAKLQFARCFWFARQRRFEEALACARRQVAICREGDVEVAALYAMSNVTLMESLLGRPREALEDARTAIARLHALGDDIGASHLYYSETIALLILDRIDDAQIAARNAYRRLRHEGDEYRMLLPLALLNALRGRLDVAARVVGFDDAIRASIGENASVDAPLLVGCLDPLLAAGLPIGERARLAAEGAALQEAEAFRLAFGDTA
jgi:predicted ATPase